MLLLNSVARYGDFFSRPRSNKEIASSVRRTVISFARRCSFAALQIAGLWALNFGGVWFVKRTALPIPGNLVGMMALYGLLVLGVVKLAWFEAATSVLIRHLAFFFVPITVGLMDAGYLLGARGLAILLILVVSAAVGLLLAGWVSQLLLSKSSRMGDRI
jgi:holin-like protein